MSNVERPMTVVVTGAAGFIGARLSHVLLERRYRVIGIDNVNDYYSPKLKETRLALLAKHQDFTFHREDICHAGALAGIFDAERPDAVVHLAAQAGVRYSMQNPTAYFESNVIGFFNVMEQCRFHRVGHFVYASSSSVYGENEKVPFDEDDRTDQPVSFYAATKKCDEVLAYAYAHNHGVPSTGLRFFTVYGPMGRPDMAYFSFADAFFQGEEISVFNAGDEANDLSRDFTYIDDVVEGIVRVIHRPPHGEVPHEIYNIGNNSPVKLGDFIRELETALSASLGQPVEIRKRFEPLKIGDVPATYASTSKLEAAVGYRPSTPLRVGLRAFTDWYVDYALIHHSRPITIGGTRARGVERKFTS